MPPRANRSARCLPGDVLRRCRPSRGGYQAGKLCSALFYWRENYIQKIGCRSDSLQVRITKPPVVTQHYGIELLVPLQQKLNRRATVLGGNNGFPQVGNAESLVIHGLQLHPRSDPSLECRTIPQHLGDTAWRTSLAIFFAVTAD